MNKFIQKRLSPVVNFVRDTRASATVEAVLILPLLMAWFVGGFVFFDGFKNRNIALKATYTIGDILSRRTTGATSEYIDNLQELFDSLAYTSGTSAMRVTSLTWNGSKHRIMWSHSTKSGLPAQTNDSVRVSSFRNRVPLMAIGEKVILVETFIDYNPAFNVGWSHHLFENFVVTSPRFASCLSWDNGVDVPSC
jgi:hypothetical protein